VGKVLAQQARERGDQPFMQYEDGEPYTYAQAHAMANRVGNAFDQEGVAFGDHVAVMLHNRLEHLWTWFGLNRIGAVYVGINTAYKGWFLTHVLANAGSRFGVMEREVLPWLADVEDTVPHMHTVFVPGPALELQDIPAFQRIRVRHFDDLLQQGTPDDIQVEVTYRDIGMILYTSGTTGPSKGVLMPHGHLYLFGLCMKIHMGLTPEDRYYICLPLFHAQGSLMQTYSTLITGASAVLVKQFRATQWIEDIRKYEATVTNSLGVMNDFILRQPAKPTDRDNKLRMMSALPVTEETLHASLNLSDFVVG
jgi:carnitine-CoA ligase